MVVIHIMDVPETKRIKTLADERGRKTEKVDQRGLEKRIFSDVHKPD